ncbi:hypothetical protein ACUW9N_001328 [Staphylococcus auricularis]|uniref:Uncharacterized protein n=1 Tax=Staphylococcus auricularis TaxID=29379 RepID=A0AAW7MDM5_9STAP|nr:hypothetical protein [Staphylococcus auricularis]MDC6327242.1 hypothetical protein [Staphylococcus auricularis]MDN4533048.1 hypothetical protein [Staphylococcus auricularis]MDN4533450.1 hypothetical protein [Staphylococcus auricularis]SQJ06390.1 Uncharacterised protein [Staphylococcus auricularis]BCU51344.1 hypothetical protein JCM2421_01160 [Staphylococcus auricularis]
MDFIIKLIHFCFSLFSIWSGASDQIRDVKRGFKRKKKQDTPKAE